MMKIKFRNCLLYSLVIFCAAGVDAQIKVVAPPEQITDAIDHKIDVIIGKLTLEEK